LAGSNSETSTLVHARPGTQYKNREDFAGPEAAGEQLPFRMHVTHSFQMFSFGNSARDPDKPQRKQT
jgi:hypothetical protein